MTSQEKKLWRTLVRICFVSQDEVSVIMPAFNPKEYVIIKKNTLPEEIIKILDTGVRLHAKVNIGYKIELVFESLVQAIKWYNQNSKP